MSELMIEVDQFREWAYRFPGRERTGMAGLQELVKQQRQKEFIGTLSRKMLSYALGRTFQPSDQSTLNQMQNRLAANGY